MLGRLILAVGLALAPVFSVGAAGIDSRVYTCSNLHSLIATQHFASLSG
jgi:hypothetical protein